MQSVLGERNTNNNCTDAIAIEITTSDINVTFNATNDSGTINFSATIMNNNSIAVGLIIH